MNRITFKLVAGLLIAAFFVGGGFTSLVESIKQEVSPPEEIQQTESLTPSPTPTETPSPSPTPQVKGTTKATPSQINDPIVDCGTGWQKETGTSFKVPKSLCDNMVECQIKVGGETETVRYPKDKCDELVEKYGKSATERTGQVNCQTKDGWVVMKKEDCAALQKQERGEQQAQVDEEVRKAFEARFKWLQEGEKKCAAQTDPLVRDECYKILKQEAQKDLEAIQQYSQ